EAQLQAEAQAEGESRMAAIMGRKVEPMVEAKPVEPVPVIEAEPAAIASTEDTTDWLAQLSAVAAAAALEPAAESSDEEPIDWLKGLGESAPVAAPVDELPDWLRAMRPPDDALAGESGLAGALGEIEATPAEALPDWLRAMQPAADASTPTESVVTEEFSVTLDRVSDEPVADLTPANALPTWLQDLQPSTAAAELTPAESLPDWLRNLQPETIEVVAEQVEASEPVVELPQAEEAPSVVEVVAEQPAAPVTEALPEPIITPISVRVQSLVADVKPEKSAAPITPTWWTQSAEDEGEAPIAELPEPVRMATTTARMTATPLAPVPAAARPPITRAMRDRLPERLTREPRRRDVRPAEPRRVESAPRHIEAAPAPVSSVNVDPLVEQLEADKFNYAVRLDLARAWWSMGNRESALAEYSKLINPAQVENLSDEELAAIEERDFADAGPVADDLIVDLERIVEIDDHPAWPRLLGDLYMKTGDLARALELYRRALSQL
ncbi:MAG: hypothetical protein KA765_18415, partial [Thermoflexales bacterium]|nr:hypothetical protein [Thermoflexales bacterium]